MQIKSGESYFKEKTETGIIFRSNIEHLEYWSDYPLPVLVVLHKPLENNCYWEIINDKTIIKTGNGWKVTIPYTQKLDHENKEKLHSFCDYPLSANDFSILSIEDTGPTAAKRYSATILLNRRFSKGEILQIAKSITNDMSKRKYYRNSLVAEQWAKKPAHVVWLFIYPSFEDTKNHNWICRTEWVDSNLDENFRPMKMDGIKIGDDFVIDWSQNYEFFSNFFNKNTVYKEDFLKEAEKILSPTLGIMQKVIKLTTNLHNNDITDEKYISEMIKHAKTLHDLYMQATDISLAPIECKDYSHKFQSVMANVDNTILPFTSLWDKKRTRENRDDLIKFHLENFLSDYQELLYEKKKIT